MKIVTENYQNIRIGKEPVVLVPLKLWQRLENYLEDQEALASKKFINHIKQGRKAASAGKLIYPSTK